MAPCSIGILVDRGQLGRSSSQSVYIATIFLGGNDDRESLAYAKRLASSPNVNLTVVHFLPMEDIENTTSEWETMLYDETLKDIKYGSLGFGQVNYIEKVVKDGPQTALIVRSMASQYNLIIVGRRYGIDGINYDFFFLLLRAWFQNSAESSTTRPSRLRLEPHRIESDTRYDTPNESVKIGRINRVFG